MALKPTLRSVPLNPREGAAAASTLPAVETLSNISTVATDYVDKADAITHFNNKVIFQTKASAYSDQAQLNNPIDPEKYRSEMQSWASGFFKANPDLLGQGGKSAAEIKATFLQIGSLGVAKLRDNQRRFQEKEIVSFAGMAKNAIEEQMKNIPLGLVTDGNEESLALIKEYKAIIDAKNAALNGAQGSTTPSQVKYEVLKFEREIVIERVLDAASLLPRAVGTKLVQNALKTLSWSNSKVLQDTIVELTSRQQGLWDETAAGIKETVDELINAGDLTQDNMPGLIKRIENYYSAPKVADFKQQLKLAQSNQTLVALSFELLQGRLTSARLDAAFKAGEINKNDRSRLEVSIEKKGQSDLQIKIQTALIAVPDLNEFKLQREELENDLKAAHSTPADIAIIEQAFDRAEAEFFVKEARARKITREKEQEEAFKRMSASHTDNVIKSINSTGRLPSDWQEIDSSIIPVDYTPPEIPIGEGGSITGVSRNEDYRKITDSDKKKIVVALRKASAGRQDLANFVGGLMSHLTDDGRKQLDDRFGPSLRETFFGPPVGLAASEIPSDFTDQGGSNLSPQVVSHEQKNTAAWMIGKSFRGVLPKDLVDSMRNIGQWEVNDYLNAIEMGKIFQANGHFGDILTALTNDSKAFELWENILNAPYDSEAIKNILKVYRDPNWEKTNKIDSDMRLDEVVGTDGETRLQIMIEDVLMEGLGTGSIARTFKYLYNAVIPKELDHALGLGIRLHQRTRLEKSQRNLSSSSGVVTGPIELITNFLGLSSGDENRRLAGPGIWTALTGAKTLGDVFTLNLSKDLSAKLRSTITVMRQGNPASTTKSIVRMALHKIGDEGGYDPSVIGDGPLEGGEDGIYRYSPQLSFRPPTITYNMTMDESRRALINEAYRNHAIMTETNGISLGGPYENFEYTRGISKMFSNAGFNKLGRLLGGVGARDRDSGRLNMVKLYNQGRLYWTKENPPGSKQYGIIIVDDDGESHPLTRLSSNKLTQEISYFKILDPNNAMNIVSPHKVGRVAE
ncbi:MAG: hypothetical protein ACKVG9_00020 [Rhodospirillales bacterium]